jgi:hypothetical protein
MSMSLPVSLGGPTRAAKPERHTVASLFAKATTKLGLGTAIAALWLIVVPIAGAAADVQISAARAAALNEGSRLAARYPTNDWGNTDIYLYRSCMARYGQKE